MSCCVLMALLWGCMFGLRASWMWAAGKIGTPQAWRLTKQEDPL